MHLIFYLTKLTDFFLRESAVPPSPPQITAASQNSPVTEHGPVYGVRASQHIRSVPADDEAGLVVTATVADVLIAILLSLKLSKSRTGYKPPDEIVGKVTGPSGFLFIC